MRRPILENLRSSLLERVGFDSLPESVWKRSAVLNTWGTNAIEGSTITREEAERLLLDEMSVEGRPVRDVIETLQHGRAFRGLLGRRGREITMVTVLELCEDVFRAILPDAGQWRRENVRIQGASFTPPRMERILQEMEAWERSYRQRDLDGEEIFSLAAWMHYEFERIHPLSDGNGRVGRLLLNLHFLRRNWPPVHVIPKHREEYLSSLNAAHRGEFSRMIELLMVLMGSSLLDLLDQVGTADDELIPLSVASEVSPHKANYLALRCQQGELPALKTGREWRTSRRALRLYQTFVRRTRGRS